MNSLLRKIAEETWDKLLKEFIMLAIASILGAAGQAFGTWIVDKYFRENKQENLKEQIVKHVKKVLDGPDIETDVLYMIGYTWAEGNQRTEFNSTLFIEMCDEFIRKHKLANKS